MPRLCLIEDDPIMGESLQDRFELEGFEVDWFERAAPARAALTDKAYAAVISDVRLPDLSGEDLFAQLRAEGRVLPPFVFITAYATVSRAVAMLKRGASDYVTKPFDIGELVTKVQAIAGVSAPPARQGDRNPVLGVSPTMREIEAQLPRIASRARTVLVTGESGSGKEVLAQRLHALAPPGPAAPFVAVNCGAIPEALLESTFFGHERGAFTGADRQRKGYLEQADGGTLFLDEVAELPPAMQVKLLRVLQERRVQRLGADHSRALDLRLVCATHRDLRADVQVGRFREDLYYRIHVVSLAVPPLRERREDILWLAQAMLAEQARLLRESPRQLSADACAALLAHPWPGNVRELRNRIERACVLVERTELHAADLFDDMAPPSTLEAGAMLPLERYLAEASRIYIQAALRRCDGRVGATAAALGISRKTLWEKARRLGLNLHESGDTDADAHPEATRDDQSAPGSPSQ